MIDYSFPVKKNFDLKKIPVPWYFSKQLGKQSGKPKLRKNENYLYAKRVFDEIDFVFFVVTQK